jgi:hypothetical protein
MAEKFGKCTQPNSHIIFRLGCIKKLTGVMHWIQNCHCTNDAPDHNNFNEEALAELQLQLID